MVYKFIEEAHSNATIGWDATGGYCPSALRLSQPFHFVDVVEVQQLIRNGIVVGGYFDEEQTSPEEEKIEILHVRKDNTAYSGMENVDKS